MADEKNTGFLESVIRMEKALSWVISHFKLTTRWPCPFCGRGEGQPLRSITMTFEDGSTSIQGCWMCNADILLDECEGALYEYHVAFMALRKAIANVPRSHHRP